MFVPFARCLIAAVASVFFAGQAAAANECSPLIEMRDAALGKKVDAIKVMKFAAA